MNAAALVASLTLLQNSTNAPGAKPFALMVGDPAPRLEPARWLKGAPLAGFVSGQTYVVEFWATWCVPCRRSMPHLCELQRRYGERVRVIGVDVWEPRPEEVEPFVQRTGDGMSYTVAVDEVPPAPADCDNVSKWSADHGKLSLSWLAASGWKEEGIPVAFVVDGQGRVAWIGDPLALDEPLAQVVDGRWSLADEARSYRTRMENAQRAQPIRKRLNDAERKRDWKTAVQCIDEILAIDAHQFADLAGGKFQTLLLELDRPDEAYAFARESLAGCARDNIPALGQIAYVIAFMAKDPLEDELELALQAATRANDLAKGERPGVLDTLARIHFLREEPELAAKLEEQAVAKARDENEKKELEERLKEYRKGGG